MAKWGNALGGWRKQPRAKDGTFGNGSPKSPAAKAARRTGKPIGKAGSKKSTPKPKTKKKSTAPKNGPTPKKNKPTPKRPVAKKRSTAPKKSSPKKSSPKKSSPQKSSPRAVPPKKASSKNAPPRKVQPKKPARRIKKRHVAAGVAAAAVLAAGALHVRNEIEYKGFLKEQNLIGEASRRVYDPTSGVSVTSIIDVSRSRGRYTSSDLVNMDRLQRYSGSNKLHHRIITAYEKAKTQRYGFRPSLYTTTFIHKDDEVIGYSSTRTVGNKVSAEMLYTAEKYRNTMTAGRSSLGHFKDSLAAHKASGRQLVLSKYRSDDSESLVKSAKRALGDKGVIVPDRWSGGNEEYFKGISKSMDASFSAMEGYWKRNRKWADEYIAGRKVG